MKHRDLLPEIKTLVNRVAPGAEVILFGSVARGQEKDDSDVDILILLNEENVNWRERDRIKDSLLDLEIETGIVIGTLVRTRKEWENSPLVSPFMINVTNEGIRL